MKARYTATAHAEVEEILAHIANDNAVAAAAVAAAINATIARLRSFPRIGAETNVVGTYITVVRPYRYLVFYEMDSETVVIRNVRHPARRRPS